MTSYQLRGGRVVIRENNCVRLICKLQQVTVGLLVGCADVENDKKGCCMHFHPYNPEKIFVRGPSGNSLGISFADHELVSTLIVSFFLWRSVAA